MIKMEYKTTFFIKTFILEIILFSLGTAAGFTGKAYYNNRKWDSIIYEGVKINGMHFKNNTVNEEKNIIRKQYIDNFMRENTNIIVDDKVYVLKNSKLVKKYYIENNFQKLSDKSGKKLTVFEKDKILKTMNSKLYKIIFVYDEDYIDDFIKGLEKNINKKPVSATIQNIGNGSIKINPDIKGYKLNDSKLKKYIKESINCKRGNRIYAPVVRYSSVVSADRLSSVNALIADFSTSFASSSLERSNNIELSAKLINGKLVMPGEIFSFNNSVGKRTQERGFMMAPVIIGDKLDSGIGGGICQVSSTLYNAVLISGMKSVERYHHTIPPMYVDLGRDATVDWGNMDFKFKNTFSYPVYMEVYTENKNLHIKIYSNSNLLKRKYIVSNNVYEVIPMTSKVSDNSVQQEGHNGYRVRVSRKEYENGSLINMENISDDLYPALPQTEKSQIKISKR